MSDSATEALFRLRLLSDHEGKLISLTAGENGVGSDARNRVCLDGRGISRFHAVLHVDPSGCELEDRGSKNGSTVNGKPVRKKLVRSGDVLGFGTVRCVLEAVHREDVELALAVEWSTRGKVTTFLGGTSDLTAASGSVDGVVLRCVGDLLNRLEPAPAPDLAGAMSDLARHLGTRGICLVEWPARGVGRVLAAAGEIGPLPDRDAVRAADPLPQDAGFRVLQLPEVGLVTAWVPKGEKQEEILGLAAFGTAVVGVQPALLGVCLQLLHRRSEQGRALVEEITQPSGRLRLPDGIVAGVSAAMSSIYRQIEMLAADEVPVLILGETGVGKEHLAQALHDGSARSDGPFIALNCAAVPAELLEAELFGIGQGVATGVTRRRGKLVQADGGTLFLDEIGDMPLALQAKLLRVLQEGEVAPLGEKPIRIDVRWVAATHADLAQSIADKAFRQDLYYRLAGYELRVPPLRRRSEDLPILVGYFLKFFSRRLGRNVRGVTVKALKRLAEHPWPGNVRELRHVVRRLVYLCPAGQAIDSKHVAEAVTAIQSDAAPSEGFELGVTRLEEYLSGHERVILEQALQKTEGNQTQAARLLGISRNNLARRLQRLGLATS